MVVGKSKHDYGLDIREKEFASLIEAEYNLYSLGYIGFNFTDGIRPIVGGHIHEMWNYIIAQGNFNKTPYNIWLVRVAIYSIVNGIDIDAQRFLDKSMLKGFLVCWVSNADNPFEHYLDDDEGNLEYLLLKGYNSYNHLLRSEVLEYICKYADRRQG